MIYFIDNIFYKISYFNIQINSYLQIKYIRWNQSISLGLFAQHSLIDKLLNNQVKFNIDRLNNMPLILTNIIFNKLLIKSVNLSIQILINNLLKIYSFKSSFNK